MEGVYNIESATGSSTDVEAIKEELDDSDEMEMQDKNRKIPKNGELEQKHS